MCPPLNGGQSDHTRQRHPTTGNNAVAFVSTRRDSSRARSCGAEGVFYVKNYGGKARAKRPVATSAQHRRPGRNRPCRALGRRRSRFDRSPRMDVRDNVPLSVRYRPAIARCLTGRTPAGRATL